MDVGIAQNLKVRKLINRKGGARALGVFVYLLCKIYKNGYYIDCNSDVIFEIAADLYEQENYVMEVILYCLEIKLFDQRMYERHHILTSRGIQERYAALQNWKISRIRSAGNCKKCPLKKRSFQRTLCVC